VDDCACESSHGASVEDAVSTLSDLRAHCPALRQLLVPDDIWDRFRGFERRSRDPAQHVSILLNSLMQGTIGRVTAPCHAYLLEGNILKASVRSQYRQDLKERWMFEPTMMERHQKARIFQGRITELQVAYWLESNGSRITGLEATGSDHDIKLLDPSSKDVAIEVKFIGQEDDEFRQGVNGLNNVPAGGLWSANAACNYLLFRLFEAATQLRGSSDRRIVICVIDGASLLPTAVRLGPIDWTWPVFTAVNGVLVSTLFDQKILEYPSIEHDLPGVITSIDELFLLARGDGFTFNTLAHHVFIERHSRNGL